MSCGRLATHCAVAPQPRHDCGFSRSGGAQRAAPEAAVEIVRQALPKACAYCGGPMRIIEIFLRGERRQWREVTIPAVIGPSLGFCNLYNPISGFSLHSSPVRDRARCQISCFAWRDTQGRAIRQDCSNDLQFCFSVCRGFLCRLRLRASHLGLPETNPDTLSLVLGAAAMTLGLTVLGFFSSRFRLFMPLAIGLLLRIAIGNRRI